MSTVDAARTDRISVWRRRYHRKGYLYILPAFLLFAFMVVYPIVRSLYLSFFDYSIIEPDSMRFVAFQNYANLWTKTANHLPLWNTFYFTIIFVPPFVAFSLVLAVMLHAVKRGSVLLRTMIFTPVVVSMPTETLSTQSPMLMEIFKQTYATGAGNPEAVNLKA